MEEKLASAAQSIIPKRLYPYLRDLYYLLKGWCYFGLRFQCPFCQTRLRKFLPGGFNFPVLLEKQVVGGGPRAHDLCPRCNASDRERLVYLYLLHKTNVFKDKLRLLHIAPEENLRKVLSAKENIDYVSGDLFMDSVSVKMDVVDIPYNNEAFAAIICNHVLEHIPDDRRALAELYRVLKPGGWAILQVPISLTLEATYEDAAITTPAARGEAFGQEDHVRLYARDYRDRLADAGFLVEEFHWRESPREFGGKENRFGLLEEETVYLARKEA